MDGLSGAASVFAVASIAIQLADGIGKLYTYWNVIKDAPAEVRRISLDLGLLSEALAEIAKDGQCFTLDSRLAVALAEAQSVVEELSSMTKDLRLGLDSKKKGLDQKWTAVKAVDKLKKNQKKLEGMKSTLQSAQLLHQVRLSRFRYENTDQKLIAIAENTSALQTIITTKHAYITPTPVSDIQSPIKTICNAETSHNAILGPNAKDGLHTVPQSLSSMLVWTKNLCFDYTYYMYSRLGYLKINSQRILVREIDSNSAMHDEDSCQYEDRTSYIVTPGPWLQYFGIDRAVHVSLTQHSISGWKSVINVYNLRPTESPIFKLCARGNVAAVRNLLSTGKASVRDIDAWGHTPLYFAVNHVRPDIYKLLVSKGAEETLPKEKGSEGDHPLQMTILRWRNIGTRLEDTINTLRTFSNLIDFEIEGSGWRMLTMLAFAHDPRFDRQDGNTDLLGWLLNTFMFDVGTNFGSRECKMLLLIMLNWEEAFDCFFHEGPTSDVDSAGPPKEYTLLQQAIVAGCNYSAVLKHRPNLHALRFDSEFSKRPETPTSIAMYSAREFQRWRRIVESMPGSIDDFIDKELEQGPLTDAGWTKNTLRQLFEYRCDPSITYVADQNGFCPIRGCVSRCGSSHWLFAGIKVQPYWMLILDLIRSGLNATDLEMLENGSPTESELRARKSARDKFNEPCLMLKLLNSANNSDKAFRAKCFADKKVGRVLDAWRLRMCGIVSGRPYEKHEVMCMHCWYNYEETGKLRHEMTEEEEEEDYIEFSPFLIHSEGDGPFRKVRRQIPSSRKAYEESYAQQAMERIYSGRRSSEGRLVDYF